MRGGTLPAKCSLERIDLYVQPVDGAVGLHEGVGRIDEEIVPVDLRVGADDLIDVGIEEVLVGVGVERLRELTGREVGGPQFPTGLAVGKGSAGRDVLVETDVEVRDGTNLIE